MGNEGLRNSGARKPGRHASAAPGGIIGLLMVMWGGMAMGAATDGTLITNVACATFGTAADSCNLSASYCVTVTVLVTNPNIQISKAASPSLECSGATVTFCIWVANTSAMCSAFVVHVIDNIPNSMSYVSGQSTWVAGTAGATLTQGYGNIGAFPTLVWTGEPSTGQTAPYAVRWIVSMIGPGKSAMLCWKGQIL